MALQPVRVNDCCTQRAKLHSVVQWFAAVDTDRSGRISVTELQEALALGNLHFSLAVCAQMIRFAAADPDCQELVWYSAEILCTGTSSVTCRLHDRSNTNNVDMQDFKALHKFLEEMNQSFQLHDSDRSGSLNSNETLAALNSAGMSCALLSCCDGITVASLR